MRRRLRWLVAAALLVGCAGHRPVSLDEAPAGPSPSAALPRPEAPVGPSPSDALPRLEARVRALDASFRADAASALVRRLDRLYRLRGNEAYEQALGEVAAHLADCGLDQGRVRRLALGPSLPAWNVERARLELEGASPVLLHAFDDPSERDRLAVLVGSHPVDGTFEVVDAAAPEVRGKLVLGEGHPSALFRRVVEDGAVGVLVLALDRSRAVDDDVVAFAHLPPRSAPAFGFSLSRRSHALLREAVARGGARVRARIEARFTEGRAHTLALTLGGEGGAERGVALFAHVDEPGAHDNASGVAALAELACAVGRVARAQPALASGAPLHLLWGQELESVPAWLRDGPPLDAALVLDMVGGDPAVVGAPFLLERSPDPAVRWPRPPDAPSGWGPAPADLPAAPASPLDDYALAAVALHPDAARGWAFRSHPFEGGSDHEPFLRAGVPAVLGWHFPDPAYHTSLDRAERVSGEEMRRVAASLGGAALGLASGGRADRLEQLAALERGAAARARELDAAARGVGADGNARAEERARIEAWHRWYADAYRSLLDRGPLPEAETARARWLEEAAAREARLGASGR